MSAELNEKWRELVAAGRAWWSTGMLGPDGFRVLTVRQDSRGFQVVSRGCGWTAPSLQSDFVPDWSDDATIGALLGQVRARWKDPATHLVPDGDWHVRGDLPWAQYGTGDTEAEALLRALEAAP